MPVGNQPTKATIDQAMTSYATQMRDLMQNIADLSMNINGQGNGLTYLESIGYGSAANPNNPGGVSDAQQALNVISYLNTVASVYSGTAAQPTQFNFDQELSQVWAGQ